jgi:hypothetical protein
MPRFRLPVYREVVVHVAGWSCYLLMQVLALDRFEHRYTQNLLAALAQLPAQLLFTYVSLYWLIPTYLLAQRYVRFGLLTLIALLMGGVIYWEGTYYLYFVPFAPERLAQESPLDVGYILLCAFYLLCTSGLLIAFHMIRYGFRQQQLNQQLIIASQAVELKLLKDQINPHFLFNTLNSLSALMMTQRTEEAERMILNLSSFFRSTLAIDPVDDVSLNEEIALQRLYLDIESARFPDRLRVVVRIPDSLMQARVPALLLQPLFENAIKYGVARSEGPVTVSVVAEHRGESLQVVVENDGDQYFHRTADGRDGEGTGVGLLNVRERLRARFGEEASCRAGHDPDGYYRVTLLMPFIAA